MFIFYYVQNQIIEHTEWRLCAKLSQQALLTVYITIYTKNNDKLQVKNIMMAVIIVSSHKAKNFQ